MHFAFTDEQVMIAETASAFFAEQATSERTRAAMEGEGIDRELWRSFTTELGLAGVALPEAVGGVGLGMVELAILAEAAGAHVAALPFLASLAIAAPAILAGGTDDQRENLLRRIAAGQSIASYAAGVGELEDGRFTGVAAMVPHGGIADVLVLDRGTNMLLIETQVGGVSIAPYVTMDQTRPYARATFKAAPAALLADPAAARVAAERSGWIAIAADALGGAQACLDRTVAYCKERVQFGRPIGSFQSIKHRLADMMVEIEQARSAVYWAACAADEGHGEAVLAAHSAKAFATDIYAKCAGHMIQLHGGIGFTWEHDAHLYFKRAQANRTLLGTAEWHLDKIAELIGLGEAA
jgi:alkylation response protein AidB-like acyl-CoA dehydrogenase